MTDEHRDFPSLAHRIAVLANPRAGTQAAAPLRETIGAAYDARAIDWSWHAPGDPGGAALDTALREALTRAPDVLVAAGGDGTVSAAANALARMPAGMRRPALGIVPLGTFNFVARRYGLDAGDAGWAAGVAASGCTRRIGAGVVNEHLFLNNCCFGLYTSLIDEREKHKRRFGRHRAVAFASALATLLKPHGRLALLLRTPERTLRLRASLVFVGVNPLQLDDLGADIAAQVGRGALACVAVRSVDAWRLLKFAWGALRDNAAELHEVEAIVVPRAEAVLRRRRLRCVVDGELMQLATPLRLAWRDDALALRVPDAAEEPS